MASGDNSKTRPRLSVAMIVRDEAQVLTETIESVRPIADEIVVLDTGSTDRTLEIARELGAVVDGVVWNDDFAAARNRCRKLATGDWVLWLDAGERLAEGSAAELREFVDGQADPGRAYMMLVETPSAASSEQIAQLRLVPNLPRLQFTGRVRETLLPSVEEAGMVVDGAPGRILRHARQHDPDRRERIARRDLEIVALASIDAEVPPPAILLATADAHAELGNLAEARDIFLSAIEAAEHGSTEMLEAYYGLLSVIDANSPGGDDPVTICLEALGIYPLDAQLLLAMGNYLQARRQFDLASRSFAAALQHGQIDPRTWHLCNLADITLDCLSLVLQVQGKDEEALSLLKEGLACDGDSIRLRRRLLELHTKLGHSDEAVELVRQFPEPPEGHGPLLDAVRGACMAATHNWTPALGCLQSAYVAGCRDPLCLRWLAVTLLSNGQIEAAEPVLREWHELEPTDPELLRYLEAFRQHRQSAATATEQPADASGGELPDQQYRVDSGTGVLSASPPQLPVIAQASSLDVN